MKKKIAILMLPLFSVLILAGCGKKDTSDQKSAGQTQTQNQNQEQEDSKTQAQGAPAEFTSACSDKNEGDICEVSMPSKNDSADSGKKISGTCKKAPQGDQLSCMPENAGPQEGGSNGSGRERPSAN
jgi:hypothetical protein